VTLANKITLARVICIPFLVLFLFIGGKKGVVFAFVIFIFATLSDFLDGWLARRKHEVTPRGKIIDPVADKILIYSVFISFIQLHLIPFWMVIIIIGRDFLVTALRIELAAKQIILAAGQLAKLKTLFEDLAVIFVFFVVVAKDFGIELWKPGMLIFVLMGVATSLAVISGIHYWIENRRYLG
jgi:CDP-diacylglycerol--glycerol-3-phosphate 3-phosphatidyltransferase